MYISDIDEAVSRIAAAPFVADEFPFDFIAAYDAPPATITRIRNGTQNASDIDGGVLWRQKLHLLVCDAGQINEALARLLGSRATATQKAKFLLATDGVEVAAHDIDAEDTIFFPFSELGNRFGFFLPLAGYSRYKAADDNPIDVKAANRLRRLYDALIAENPEWEGDAKRHAMNLFMTRIIFCMFAEDTGIIPEHLFARTIHDHGGHAGEEMVHVLTSIFTAMSIREGERGDMPRWATDFPWVNGGLFAGDIEVPRFSRTAFRTLTEAAGLRWNEINADIFGSMIQVIVDPAHRHETGMHYTSVPNILKVLDPLFLDELRTEASRPALADNSREKARLKALLTRLSKIRVFDPACGSGNFLVIAYQELRKIERQVLDRLRAITGHAPGIWSHIELHNFYGIEISDFAAETAKLSLWIAKFQMDRAHRDMFGSAPPSLPLTDSGNIHNGNALAQDWLGACPAPISVNHRQKMPNLATAVDAHGTEEVIDGEVETYIVGNPPYIGARKMNDVQKAEMRTVAQGYTNKWTNIDYVGGWFIRAMQYSETVPNVCFAFVATNSLCQGQQVPTLWPILLENSLAIRFAHRSFKWINNAPKKAGVICVVVGMDRVHGGARTLFDGNLRQEVSTINAYLLPLPNIYIDERTAALCELPPMDFGNMPLDNGNLLIEPAEIEDFQSDPVASTFVRPIVGSKEAIRSIDRYCLWIEDDRIAQALAIPEIDRRIEATRVFRAGSPRPQTRSKARTPYKFGEIRQRNADHIIVVPSASSERRPYLPVLYMPGETIVSNLAFMMFDAPLWTISLIASRMHLLWIEAVCGKLKTDYRYSNTLGWYTFPVPSMSQADYKRLESCAENILLARAEVGGSIAEQYDPNNMHQLLIDAHTANDEAVESLYSGRGFRSDGDRLGHLFRRYAKLTADERGQEVDPEFALGMEGAA
ncbi:class I SAM-dependent DNA methyltransferase [Novosphingobium clariflavum]|uniref:site-specific DNA-methyltransferase (adenine-specific) n=1 Tax=Novosphingobium clariflavum TaxID=2029884 RepID=A0ABV6S8W5_9SPHN|nr:DNA methyltransferase [Novosphingobium clariflavum]